MGYQAAIINRLAGGTIAAFTIVKKGADDNNVVAAAAATDKLLGVTTGPVQLTSATGDRVTLLSRELPRYWLEPPLLSATS